MIEHRPSGIMGEASERRSQEENRRKAIFRLRINLAVAIRQPCDIGGYQPSPRWAERCRRGIVSINPQHADFPALLAEALDVVVASDMEVKDAATRLGCSTSQLVKLLNQEPQALAHVNSMRKATGKRPYLP